MLIDTEIEFLLRLTTKLRQKNSLNDTLQLKSALKHSFKHKSDVVANATKLQWQKLVLMEHWFRRPMFYMNSLAGERATMRALALQLITSCRSAEP